MILWSGAKIPGQNTDLIYIVLEKFRKNWGIGMNIAPVN